MLSKLNTYINTLQKAYVKELNVVQINERLFLQNTEVLRRKFQFL